MSHKNSKTGYRNRTGILCITWTNQSEIISYWRVRKRSQLKLKIAIGKREAERLKWNNFIPQQWAACDSETLCSSQCNLFCASSSSRSLSLHIALSTSPHTYVLQVFVQQHNTSISPIQKHPSRRVFKSYAVLS